MRVVVLLSAGRHPVSLLPAPVMVELQAIGLALSLTRDGVGLHAGPETALLRDHAGYGLATIHRLDGEPDPERLAPILRALEPAIVLAGRRGVGGTDSGMLPYQLAHALGWPIAADVVDIEREEGGYAVSQFRPHGARRLSHRSGPLLASVHPAAPKPPAFVFARSRTALVNPVAAPDIDGLADRPGGTAETRPYKPRPRVIAPGTVPVSRTLLQNVEPEVAAAAILDHLQRLGLLAPPAGSE